mmetsp:Transcript_9504/g.14674  ORF Transcript_9504/g.14674 Transcript_9504/m.14674 type:complete len:358 (-) Transcript_9504:224-1297(-)
MNISLAATLSLITAANGFTLPNSRQTGRLGRIQVVSEPTAAVEAATPVESVNEAEAPVAEVAEPEPVPEVTLDPREKIQPGRFDGISYSVACPLLEKPANLDGSHAGDFGFDPLGLSQEFDLYYMQECELRHARLAMLAVAGWPLSELVAPSWMLQDGRAPSVLNGVNPISFLAIVSALGALGFLEYKTSLRKVTGKKLGDIHEQDMSLVWKYGVAGDYNFDPANLYSSLGDDAAGRKGLRQLEVTQGRYAMLAITYFAAWEALTGHPIVENNPLFHPNGLVPLAAISYFAWSQIYQVSDIRNAPIKIEYTKDGEDILRGIKRTTDNVQRDMGPKMEAAMQFTTESVKKFKELQESA